MLKGELVMVNVAVEGSNKQDTFDCDIQIFLPAFLGNQKSKTDFAAANIKSFEFHFLKLVYF
ncbi:hypothetical protein QUA56_19960 [Microcoleus sp. N3A4]|uniref:hypothetical protein n=1 Tax=Microcoleus sp. N3A4 TaxID=3055379 RepID=UPI002FD24C38